MADRGHDHVHASPVDEDSPHSYHQTLEVAVRELLIEKGVIDADEVRAAVEEMDARTPARGARVVARAWTDPDFRARLLADAPAACRELDIDVSPAQLTVTENTEDVHNVIVCTLCSCYPRPLLGLPPSWYKSASYRSRAVREPRAVLQEFGLDLPETVAVRVHDSTADLRYIVLPQRPEGTDTFSEDDLAALVTRDCLIGVAVPRVTRTVAEPASP
ncbi:MAG: nitrile hydratase subunit alpha [Actinomycetia bacterium]|nr:nitrile hydratase subunit alpha [Actinomycetes bacterium]